MDPQLNKNLEEVTELFSQYLSGVFEMEDETTEMLNEEILLLLFENDIVRKDLINAILAYRENLVNKHIVIDGRNQSPTVANWIKDFIAMQGSGNFNDLILSQYLVRSRNARSLGPDDKILLRKVLILYKNIKFFPESMGNQPPEEWRIIPVDSEAVELKFKDSGKGYSEIELQKIAAKYPPGSLERKAVDEEMKKLGN